MPGARPGSGTWPWWRRVGLWQGVSALASVVAVALVVQPIGAESAGAGRSFELWAVPAQGAPRSLGLVDGRQATTVRRDALLRDTAAFAVSLEPAGGSTTGAPSGPVISVGKLVR